MKAVILTEAGQGIGFGHLSRCAGLAQALREKNVECRLFVHGDRSISHQLLSCGGQIKNWLYHQNERRQCLRKSSVAIVDSYLAPPRVLKSVEQNTTATFYIDDYLRIAYPRGIVINGSLNAPQLNYKKSLRPSFLLGAKFIPLRRPFWDVAGHRVRKNIKKILITFGGTDEADLTSRVLSIVKEKYPLVSKIVVIGSGFRRKARFLKKKEKNVRFVIGPDAQRMARLIQDADFAVSSGGQTLYELARCGIGAVVVIVADNQKGGVKAWGKTGCFFCAGTHNDAHLTKQIHRGLNKVSSFSFRRRCAQQGPKVIDGQGARRIAAACLKVYTAQGMCIRPAERKDAKAIFELSNQPVVRQSSFRSHKIKWQEHQKWFAKTLLDRQIFFLVAYAQNDLLGQIRFCIRGNNAVVSVSINPLFQNCGIGKKLFFTSISYLQEKNVCTVQAFIKKENKSSQIFFSSLGFKNAQSLETPRGGACMRFIITR